MGKALLFKGMAAVRARLSRAAGAVGVATLVLGACGGSATTTKPAATTVTTTATTTAPTSATTAAGPPPTVDNGTKHEWILTMNSDTSVDQPFALDFAIVNGAVSDGGGFDSTRGYASKTTGSFDGNGAGKLISTFDQGGSPRGEVHLTGTLDLATNSMSGKYTHTLPTAIQPETGSFTLVMN